MGKEVAARISGVHKENEATETAINKVQLSYGRIFYFSCGHVTPAETQSKQACDILPMHRYKSVVVVCLLTRKTH